MEPAGQCSLNWPIFDHYTRNAVRGLSLRHKFVDVTLACEEGEVQAYKVILAAGSNFFRLILLRMTLHPHPVIYLENIGTNHLQALVAFMYTGETTIPKNTLDDFMRVEGLLEPESKEGIKQNQDGSQASLRSIKKEGMPRAVAKAEPSNQAEDEVREAERETDTHVEVE